jgi:hypothetical protein
MVSDGGILKGFCGKVMIPPGQAKSIEKAEVATILSATSKDIV